MRYAQVTASLVIIQQVHVLLVLTQPSIFTMVHAMNLLLAPMVLSQTAWPTLAKNVVLPAYFAQTIQCAKLVFLTITL